MAKASKNENGGVPFMILSPEDNKLAMDLAWAMLAMPKEVRAAAFHISLAFEHAAASVKAGLDLKKKAKRLKRSSHGKRRR